MNILEFNCLVFISILFQSLILDLVIDFGKLGNAINLKGKAAIPIISFSPLKIYLSFV